VLPSHGYPTLQEAVMREYRTMVEIRLTGKMKETRRKSMQWAPKPYSKSDPILSYMKGDK
jgi:hypothetical protein